MKNHGTLSAISLLFENKIGVAQWTNSIFYFGDEAMMKTVRVCFSTNAWWIIRTRQSNTKEHTSDFLGT
jgi:hypothetical protein